MGTKLTDKVIKLNENETIAFTVSDDGLYVITECYVGDRCKLRESLYSNEPESGVFWLYDRRLVGVSTGNSGYFVKTSRDAEYPVGSQVNLRRTRKPKPELHGVG